MGNQNSSSGLLAEQKPSEKDDEVSSPLDRKEQNEDERRDFRETEDADSEANITPLVVENLAFGSEEVSEEPEKVAAAVPKAPNGQVEPDGSILEEKMLNNEIQDQALTLKEDMQRQDLHAKPKSAEILTFTPQEDQKITSPKETVGTLEVDDNVERHEQENNNVTAEIASVEGKLSDTSIHEDELKNSLASRTNGLENDATKETRDEESNSIDKNEEINVVIVNVLSNGGAHADHLPPCNQEIENEKGERREVKIDSLPSLAKNNDFLDEVMAEEESALESRPSEIFLQNKDSNTEAQNEEDEESILINGPSNILEKPKENIEGENRVLDREPKGQESEKISDKSRKCPSFDFGLPFDAKFDESDQTPLLYRDGTRVRSFSGSCSTLRVQNRSVQTEYFEKPLHIEGMEVEEKTIRMERCHSDGLKTSTKMENADIIAKPKDKNRVSDNTREIGFKALEEDCAMILSKGREKRKVWSSLFMNCICCTEAIN